MKSGDKDALEIDDKDDGNDDLNGCNDGCEDNNGSRGGIWWDRGTGNPSRVMYYDYDQLFSTTRCMNECKKPSSYDSNRSKDGESGSGHCENKAEAAAWGTYVTIQEALDYASVDEWMMIDVISWLLN